MTIQYTQPTLDLYVKALHELVEGMGIHPSLDDVKIDSAWVPVRQSLRFTRRHTYARLHGVENQIREDGPFRSARYARRCLKASRGTMIIDYSVRPTKPVEFITLKFTVNPKERD